MLQLTAAMVGMLGGPALMVFTVLSIEKQPRSLSFLCDMCNLSDKTCSQACRKLKTLGMITENGRYLYQIAGKIEQLPFMAPELPETTESTAIEHLGRKISDLAINESINESLTESSDEDDSFIDEGPAPEFPDLVTEAGLKDLKFYGKGIREMLAIPGLTMREVRYQVKHSPNLGCALSRIRKRQPVLDNWERAGPSEDRRKYVSGEFSEFINQ